MAHNPFRTKDAQRMWRLASRYTSVGIEIALGFAVGTYGGKWLDERWGTEPYLLYAGLALGLGNAINSVVRAVRRTHFDRLDRD